MAKHRSRYSGHQSKADKVKAHVAKHSAAYEKHLKAAAKNVPEPGQPGHDDAWNAATAQAAQGAAAETAPQQAMPSGGAPPAVPGLPPGVPPQMPAAA